MKLDNNLKKWICFVVIIIFSLIVFSKYGLDYKKFSVDIYTFLDSYHIYFIIFFSVSGLLPLFLSVFDYKETEYERKDLFKPLFGLKWFSNMFLSVLGIISIFAMSIRTLITLFKWISLGHMQLESSIMLITVIGYLMAWCIYNVYFKFLPEVLPYPKIKRAKPKLHIEEKRIKE